MRAGCCRRRWAHGFGRGCISQVVRLASVISRPQSIEIRRGPGAELQTEVRARSPDQSRFGSSFESCRPQGPVLHGAPTHGFDVDGAQARLGGTLRELLAALVLVEALGEAGGEDELSAALASVLHEALEGLGDGAGPASTPAPAPSGMTAPTASTRGTRTSQPTVHDWTSSFPTQKEFGMALEASGGSGTAFGNEAWRSDPNGYRPFPLTFNAVEAEASMYRRLTEEAPRQPGRPMSDQERRDCARDLATAQQQRVEAFNQRYAAVNTPPRTDLDREWHTFASSVDRGLSSLSERAIAAGFDQASHDRLLSAASEQLNGYLAPYVRADGSCAMMGDMTQTLHHMGTELLSKLAPSAPSARPAQPWRSHEALHPVAAVHAREGRSEDGLRSVSRNPDGSFTVTTMRLAQGGGVEHDLSLCARLSPDGRLTDLHGASLPLERRTQLLATFSSLLSEGD